MNSRVPEGRVEVPITTMMRLPSNRLSIRSVAPSDARILYG
ncbi:MAG: hypothetical protein ABSE96_07505 [Terracidiphilus sp.]